MPFKHKLRDWFVEGKLYYARATTYLTIFNFLMIAIMFINTTLWEYQPFQSMFPSRKIFLLVGLIFVITVIALVGYLDTKLKLWRTESEKGLMPDRSPALIPVAFQCAKMLNELKKENKDTKDLEANLNEIFARCKMSKEFEFFKEQTK
jgi:uncharacterized membrane protein